MIDEQYIRGYIRIHCWLTLLKTNEVQIRTMLWGMEEGRY